MIDPAHGGHARLDPPVPRREVRRPPLPAGRRLRPLPRPGRPRRRARLARAARRHRARPGRRQRRHPRRRSPPPPAMSSAARPPSSPSPTGCAASWRRRCRMRAARSRSSTAASTSSCSGPLPRPTGPPAFLCVGSLTERKNVLRLANAFERLGEGTLTFVGDGPLRPQLEGRPGIELAGHVPHDDIPARLAAARVVCGPSLVEPFGQALLEALAAGRPVVATNVGGPPEFVPARGGRARRSARRGRDPRRAPPRRRAPVPERGGDRGRRASTTSAARPSGSRRSWRGPRARPSPGGEARRRRCRRATRDRVRGGRGRCASPRGRYGCPCGP